MKKLTQSVIEEVLKEYSDNYDVLGENPNIKDHKMSEARTFCLLFQILQDKLEEN